MRGMEYEPLPASLGPAVRKEMQRLGVPGVGVGVVHGGRAYAEGFGVTNVDHPLAVTPETLFQIGSTSKTFTATALMMLVEEGRVDLAARVREYLPGFRLQSEADAAALTVRHLVTHHGGWQGDYFRDTGRGDDAIARIVAKMANSPQVMPAGAAFSYNNAGFYVLARIIEVVSGEVFESFVTERIFSLLGMTRSTYFPEQAIVHRVAAGHVSGPDGPRVATPWNVPRSIAGGGGIISNAIEQAAYAAFHLGDGRTPAGERLLRAETMAFMQSPLAPAGSVCDYIGVSWEIGDIHDVTFVKHGGATNGHLSAFELAPDHGYACTVLTNAETGRELRNTVAEACREHFLGLGPAEFQAIAPPADLGTFTGTFEWALGSLEVVREGAGLAMAEGPPARARHRGAQVPPGTPPMELTFVGVDRAAVLAGPRRGETVEFLRDSDGKVAFARWDGRIAPRSDS